MFTVYRPYFDAILAGTKTIEFRDAKKPWLAYLDRMPDEAWFLCGNRKARFEIEGVVLWAGRLEFRIGRRLE